MKCLRDMLMLPRNGPTYIILDALDECPKSAGTPSPRESVLELVEWLAKSGKPNLHVCVTSRLEADIEANFQPLASYRVSLHDESDNRKTSTTLSSLSRTPRETCASGSKKKKRS
jgi:hypothetical protein